MTPLKLPVTATLALSATLGCTIHLNNGSDDDSSSDPGTSGSGEDPTTGTGGTTVETPTTSDTSGAPETGTSAPGTTDTGETDTGNEPVWCNGFDPQLAALTIKNSANIDVVDGTSLAAECGGQGTLMIPIFPHFGGFTPTGDKVTFDVILDVEGFNIGPNDHFFEVAGREHEINCAEEETYGGYYSYSFIPIFPPDAIPDINAIDGKPGLLKVTLHTPDGDVPFEADVVLAAMVDECYGGG